MISVVLIDEVEETLSASLRDFLGSKEREFRPLLRQFHNILAKNIRPRPRKVHTSREVQQHQLFLNEKRHVIEQIVEDIEAGRDLTKYLSKKSEQPQYYDKSLAHFGVHHLHLGEGHQTKNVRSRRVKGTKSLLFARVLEDDIYLLDILNHDLHASFLNIHFLRVMHRNWPDSIESFRAKEAIGVAHKYTDSEAAELLENDINLLIELGPNQVYLLPGMGTTAAGTPTLVETRVNSTIHTIQKIS